MSTTNMHNIDFKKFMEAIDQCKGDVYLVTEEGDRLNLKSKLCQIIGFTKLIEGGTVTEAKIVCSDPDDDTLLFRFNLYGDGIIEDKKEDKNAK